MLSVTGSLCRFGSRESAIAHHATLAIKPSSDASGFGGAVPLSIADGLNDPTPLYGSILV
jgi:hypothetical protein